MAHIGLERLRVTWQRHVGDGADAPTRFDGVVRGYTEPHRRYHNLDHLGVVLDGVLDLAGHEPVGDLPAVVAAAFYHDVAYDPLATDNEHRSAVWAEHDLVTLGWEPRRARRVGDMVRATAGHESTDPDTAVLLDADLAVLGRDGYDRYVAAVRAEYAVAGIDDRTWNRGRAAVLRRFLERDRLFATPTGRARWEAAARRHLSDELTALDG